MKELFDLIMIVEESKDSRICLDCQSKVNKLFFIKSRNDNSQKQICINCKDFYKIVGLNFKEEIIKTIDEFGMEIFEFKGKKYIEVPCIKCKKMPPLQIPYDFYKENPQYWLNIKNQKRNDN